VDMDGTIEDSNQNQIFSLKKKQLSSVTKTCSLIPCQTFDIFINYKGLKIYGWEICLLFEHFSKFCNVLCPLSIDSVEDST